MLKGSGHRYRSAVGIDFTDVDAACKAHEFAYTNQVLHENLIGVSKAFRSRGPRPPPSVLDTEPVPTDTNAPRRQTSENERKVAEMTEEEIERERRDILEQLSSDTGELLKRIGKRDRKLDQEVSERSIEDKADDVSRPTTRHAPSAVPPARSSTRPSSRASRKLRFAEVTPTTCTSTNPLPSLRNEQYSYFHPHQIPKMTRSISRGTYKVGPVPRKRPHPADSPTDDTSVDQPTTDGTEPEEGTPEYIRRRPFPGIAAPDPSLAWIDSSSSETDHSAPCFDLNGAPIPASLSVTLPSHFGVHHHAAGTHAGYTIDYIFLLSRSTVPAQRVSMLSQQARQANLPDKITEFSGKEGELRKRVLAAGLVAMDQIGSLECLVEWDRTYRLAQEPNELAEAIVNTPPLVAAILQTFILTPIPPREESPLPNPFAIQLLITLASASRADASALLDPTDALLRFVTLLPPSSPFESSLVASLLTSALCFYTTIASYGLYCHIATTVSQYFSTLGTYVLSTETNGQSETQPKLPLPSSPSSSTQLRVAWASLVEAWIACAKDPHATSPPHEILWSQVSVWGWGMEARMLREGLGMGESERGVWAAAWSAEAAFEGRRGPRVCDSEQFAGGDPESFGRPTVGYRGRSPEQSTAVASHAGVISSALRLWLACLPPSSDGTSLYTPPFLLPFSDLSALCAILVKHLIWFFPSTSGTHLQVHLRPLTSLLARFHRVSRHIPGTTPHLWLAQGLVFLSRLLPGDEAHALAMLDTLSLIVPQFIGVQPLQLPESITMDILKPSFEHIVRPDPIAPLRPTPESVPRSSTLHLPGPSTTGGAGEDMQKAKAGLPLPRDWLTSPLTHLLRSGTSPVFRTLPTSWAASEVDVVRAMLGLLYAARRVLVDHDLGEFVLGPAEVLFAGMRVCMLEHGVVGGNVSAGNGGIEMDEVFRDEAVEKLMKLLLAPYTPHAASSSSSSLTLTLTSPPVSPSEAAPLPKLIPQTFLELASPLPPANRHSTLPVLYGPRCAVLSCVVWAPGLRCIAPPAARDAVCGGLSAASVVRERGRGWRRWRDVLRSVTVGAEGVVCTELGWEGWDGNIREPNVREYMYPIERDGRLLGATGTGLLALLAVHHVACAIWEDLKAQAPTRDTSAIRAGEVEVGAKLLRMVLGRGDDSTVREVLLYRQSPRGAFVWPPACYKGGRDWDGGTDGGGELLSGWKAAEAGVRAKSSWG
ncbi:hypothetical protein BU15DRAFT_67920 [Melanogaster broomeanus]|nr:hypothetical protein BU15DRAFT_67920 [Melanogaster broomeanus]